MVDEHKFKAQADTWRRSKQCDGSIFGKTTSIIKMNLESDQKVCSIYNGRTHHFLQMTHRYIHVLKVYIIYIVICFL